MAGPHVVTEDDGNGRQMTGKDKKEKATSSTHYPSVRPLKS